MELPEFSLLNLGKAPKSQSSEYPFLRFTHNAHALSQQKTAARKGTSNARFSNSDLIKEESSIFQDLDQAQTAKKFLKNLDTGKESVFK